MISTYFGPPGCGKTTVSTALAVKFIKRKKPIPVFSNYFIEGANFLDVNDLGSYSFPDGAQIIVDEAGIDFSNHYHSAHKVVAFFKLHRHFRVDIHVFSQTFSDMEKRIRDLSVTLFHLKKIGPFILCRKIGKFIHIDDEKHDIVEGYKFRSLTDFLFFMSPIRIFFAPRYWKFFDSWDAPELPPIPVIPWTKENSKLILAKSLSRFDNSKSRFEKK